MAWRVVGLKGQHREEPRQHDKDNGRAEESNATATVWKTPRPVLIISALSLTVRLIPDRSPYP